MSDRVVIATSGKYFLGMYTGIAGWIDGMKLSTKYNHPGGFARIGEWFANTAKDAGM
jgi:hypothetical protein